jgi:hypothetical protein
LSDKLVERLREPRAVYWGNGAGPLLLAAADRIEALEQALRQAQARIDALMLEFCPNEMTPEQISAWADCQKVAPERQ